MTDDPTRPPEDAREQLERLLVDLEVAADIHRYDGTLNDVRAFLAEGE